MEQLKVALGERSYPIYIAPQLLSSPTPDANINDFIAGKHVFILTNDVVAPLYLESLKAQLSDHLLVDELIIADGEQNKSLASFERACSQLIENRHPRDTTVLALGGGVVGDLSGFVAASFQRGVPFIQIPTTLLSQVDSSVGGKTAVNHPLGKNLIGAFYQPQAVFIDTCTLETLPPREYAAGIAEVIKYGIIWDSEFFVWLEQNVDAIRAKQPSALQYMVKTCCAIKADVVAQDETEQSVRALLNLGHTFGHAIEAHTRYLTWLHGEAVAAGTLLAAKLAQTRGWLTATETRRISDLFEAFDLPLQAPDDMNCEIFVNHMQRDKKVLSGQMRFILPQGLGKAVVVDDVTEQELQHLLA